MKKLKLLILFTVLSFGVFSQSLLPIKYGVKLGSNIANITSTSNEGVENIKNSTLIGMSGGFYMEIALNEKWYINPELMYMQKGVSFTHEYIHDYPVDTGARDIHNSSHELKLAYIELGPTISYKASDKLSLNFGPSFSFLISSDYVVLTDEASNDSEDLHEILPDAEYKEETLDVGLNLGVSYYLSENFLIDGKVNTGFLSIGKVIKETRSGGNDPKEHIFDLKNRGVVFSIAYIF